MLRPFDGRSPTCPIWSVRRKTLGHRREITLDTEEKYISYITLDTGEKCIST